MAGGMTFTKGLTKKGFAKQSNRSGKGLAKTENRRGERDYKRGGKGLAKKENMRGEMTCKMAYKRGGEWFAKGLVI